MMTDQEVTQDQLDQLFDDAGYLQDEAEALKYVIEQVPYTENPPSGYSIYTMLRLLDHAQVNFYRPIIERVFSENRIVNLSTIDNYEETFEEKEDDEADVYKVLNKIIKHRAALLNVMNKITLIDWERELKDENGNIISLYDFATYMIKQERGLLKKIADLVLIYQNEKLSKREIDARVNQRKLD
jgi:hypothetical protein